MTPSQKSMDPSQLQSLFGVEQEAGLSTGVECASAVSPPAGNVASTQPAKVDSHSQRVDYPDWNEINTSYSPPVVYLHFPLETGKTWSTTTLVETTGGARYEMVLEGSVVGPATVTVPGGTFDVIVVPFETRIERWTGTGGLVLHRQLGHVGNLERWSGIVSTDATTRGHLKSLFR